MKEKSQKENVRKRGYIIESLRQKERESQRIRRKKQRCDRKSDVKVRKAAKTFDNGFRLQTYYHFMFGALSPFFHEFLFP